MDELLKISIEDLEDIGFYRLGHQKRLLLGIKKVRELKKLGQQPLLAAHQQPANNDKKVDYHASPGGKNLHYYPEQLPFQSLPPSGSNAPHHRFSSFHHDSTPLVDITEGEVWRREGGGVGMDGGIPRPMPGMEPGAYKPPQYQQQQQQGPPRRCRTFYNFYN